MAGFPKLIPAFTLQVVIEPPTSFGATARSGPVTHAIIRPDAGSMRSEPGYALQVDAAFAHGSDFIRADQDGQRVRLEVHSLLKDKTGALIRCDYTGVVPMTGAAGKVLRGEKDAATTGFELANSVSFETSDKALFEIQNKVYVGTGRFILEPGKGPVVEYKISEVTA